MDSHIQINQSVLNRFAHKEEYITDKGVVHVDSVYYFDFSKSSFGCQKVKDFGTKVNYYEDDVEKDLLNNKVESPFGQVIYKINKSKSFDRFKLNDDEKEIIIKYAFYSVRRCESNIDKVKDYYKKIGKDISASDVLRASVDINKTFKYRNIKILVNKTSEDFIVPYNCLIYVYFHGRKCCILPISTKKAICLSIDDIDPNSQIIDIDDLNTINNVNMACFDVEKRNKNLIICRNKETVIKLCRINKIKINETECDA